MNKAYNLRSLNRKASDTKCYLQDVLNSSRSVDIKNPRVCLKRMKIFERPDSSNYTYIIHGDVIKTKKVKNNKTYQKLFFLLIFAIGVIFFMYFKGDIKHFGSKILKQAPNIYKTLNNYYHTIQTPQKNSEHNKLSFSGSFLEKTINNKSQVCINQKNSNDMLNVKSVIRNYILEFKKKNFLTFVGNQCCKEFKTNETGSHKEGSNIFNEPENVQPENLIDYALESKGAKILSTFETELYGAVALKFWNFDFGIIQNSFFQNYFNPRGPSSILVPWKKPGDCWAFKGSRGRVQIKLSQKIIITAVTIDHATKDIFTIENIKSAPRKFYVMAIEKDKDLSKRIFLGSFEYALPGPPVQTFTVIQTVKTPCEVLELAVESNNGNPEYTCLYKVRVHGYK